MKQPRLSGAYAEFIRFTAVAVAGLVVDISLAWVLSSWFGINLLWAAAAGFLFGAGLNYLLHEFWTFQRGQRQVSKGRILRYCGVLGATLATRLVLVYLLSQTLKPAVGNLSILLLATALSFFINYLLSKLFVFRSTSVPTVAGKGKRL